MLDKEIEIIDKFFHDEIHLIEIGKRGYDIHVDEISTMHSRKDWVLKGWDIFKYAIGRKNELFGDKYFLMFFIPLKGTRKKKKLTIRYLHDTFKYPSQSPPSFELYVKNRKEMMEYIANSEPVNVVIDGNIRRGYIRQNFEEGFFFRWLFFVE